jgi:hypothetical protein
MSMNQEKIALPVTKFDTQNELEHLEHNDIKKSNFDPKPK